MLRRPRITSSNSILCLRKADMARNPPSVASGSVLRRAATRPVLGRKLNCPQDVSENAVLQVKCLGAIVLVIPRGHHDNEIELWDDAYRLPASANAPDPADFTPIEPGLTEPPEVSIKKAARGVELRPSRSRSMPSRQSDGRSSGRLQGQADRFWPCRVA